MTKTPLFDFFAKSKSFKPIDVAVLFALMAYQECADPFGMPISLAIKKRVWCVEATEGELEESLQRLISLGEVEQVEDGNWKGYRVVRYQTFLDLVTEFGGRRYARLRARASREAKESKGRMETA